MASPGSGPTPGTGAIRRSTRTPSIPPPSPCTTPSPTRPSPEPTTTPPAGSYVSRIVIAPANPNTAYLTLSGFGLPGQHIWKTTDLAGLLAGTNPGWTPAGFIPDIPVNSLVVDPNDS